MRDRLGFCSLGRGERDGVEISLWGVAAFVCSFLYFPSINSYKIADTYVFLHLGVPCTCSRPGMSKPHAFIPMGLLLAHGTKMSVHRHGRPCMWTDIFVYSASGRPCISSYNGRVTNHRYLDMVFGHARGNLFSFCPSANLN